MGSSQDVGDSFTIALALGKRCSVESSLRYRPTPCTGEQRSAQDYTFEALHRVYFYDAWRAQPVLDAPGSELVLPPQPGLSVHGCYWPQPSATPDVLSVSDRATEEEEHGVQAGQPLSSPAAKDATMADEEASEAFPRVRTPCGHGAQVIVEGREEQTDGGERNEDPKTNPNQTPKPAGRNSTIL